MAGKQLGPALPRQEAVWDMRDLDERLNRQNSKVGGFRPPESSRVTPPPRTGRPPQPMRTPPSPPPSRPTRPAAVVLLVRQGN
jgi:hypothetical protein